MEPTFTLLKGHAVDRLAELPGESVHCVVTSPPYWRLRSYGTEAQEWPDGWTGELGWESTPQQYVAHLVGVLAGVKRVLRSDGVCFVVVDDSYLPGKGLALVPERLATALADAGWIVRCDVIWNPANPMPESVTDRPTRSHEYVWMLTKGSRYFWNADAVKEEAQDWNIGGQAHRQGQRVPGVGIARTDHYSASSGGNEGLAALAARYRRGEVEPTRNIRSVWPINAETFYGGHYAVMPVALAVKCIEAATSVRCCSVCGSQTECECGAESVPTRVLDPFGGAGTTAVAARRLGRSSVLIELGDEYAAMAKRRMMQWWRDPGPSPLVPENQLALLDDD